MKIMTLTRCIYAALLACLSGQGAAAQGTDGTEAQRELLELRRDMTDKTVALNPVTDFDCADPSVVRIGQWFYCFMTGYPVKIYRSRDLCNWTYYRDMFPGPTPHDPYGDGQPDPMHTGAGEQNINYWAPSAAVIKGKLVVYLTLFVSMQNDRQVVCVAEDIDSPFRYANTLNVGTPEHPTPQDGQYFRDDDGRHYLVYGDVNSKGNYIRELDKDGLRYAKGSEPHYITTAYEGGYIYKHKGLYYYFCSRNYYNSHEYTLCMSTSSQLLSGWSEPQPVLTSESADAILNGAGHNGEIITDRDGRMFMPMHAHCEGLLPRPGNYRPRPMILMELLERNGHLTFVDHKGRPARHPQWLVRAPRF